MRCAVLLAWLLVAGTAFGLQPLLGRSRALLPRRQSGLYALPTAKADPAPLSFDAMKALDERCAQLCRSESEFMLSFWSEQLQCFQLFPGQQTERVSLSTSCITLMAIRASPANWKDSAIWQAPASPSAAAAAGKAISLSRVVDAIRQAPWSGDTYQTQLLVSTLCSFPAAGATDAKLRSAVDMLLDQRSRLSLHRNQNISAYLRHQNVLALLALASYRSLPQLLEGEDAGAVKKSIGYALERANLVAFDELCRQLAFYNADDSGHFDVVVLAYSLLAYWETSSSLFLSSFARGVVPNTNIKLVKAALEILFAAQSTDGTWRKGEPINQAGKSDGRDIGNNYVFFFDLIASTLGSIGEQQPQLLAPYLMQLERCVSWAESNMQQEMLPEEEEGEAGSRRRGGRMVRGWRSNHLGTGQPVAWCTAQVFMGLGKLRRLLQQLLTANILSEFGGAGAGLGASSGEWTGLMDADLELAGQPSSLKVELFSRLLCPLRSKERGELEALFGPRCSSAEEDEDAEAQALMLQQQEGGGLDLDVGARPVRYRAPVYSAILFGPPGTAKTTICTSMARYLGWNFVTIDTACFLADGLGSIAARMSYVFRRLEALERTIILFDEIEEFCLDRENPTLAMESRLLTTAMLTQLNDLRRKQTSVFLVATNRLRSFDAAVTRPGRFDMLLFVGTPNLSARSERLTRKLAATALPLQQQAHARAHFEDHMRQHWEQVRFLTFAENEALLLEVVDFALAGDITEEAMGGKIASLLRTATIQGAVKEEYVASEAMSRT